MNIFCTSNKSTDRHCNEFSCALLCSCCGGAGTFAYSVKQNKFGYHCNRCGREATTSFENEQFWGNLTGKISLPLKENGSLFIGAIV